MFSLASRKERRRNRSAVGYLGLRQSWCRSAFPPPFGSHPAPRSNQPIAVFAGVRPPQLPLHFQGRARHIRGAGRPVRTSPDPDPWYAKCSLPGGEPAWVCRRVGPKAVRIEMIDPLDRRSGDEVDRAGDAAERRTFGREIDCSPRVDAPDRPSATRPTGRGRGSPHRSTRPFDTQADRR